MIRADMDKFLGAVEKAQHVSHRLLLAARSRREVVGKLETVRRAGVFGDCDGAASRREPGTGHTTARGGGGVERVARQAHAGGVGAAVGLEPALKPFSTERGPR